MSRTVATTQCTYHRETSTLVIEASDICRAGEQMFMQIYPDACDEGLILIGKTGREYRYVVIEHRRDTEGDSQFWTLAPTALTARQFPECCGIKLQIFND